MATIQLFIETSLSVMGISFSEIWANSIIEDKVNEGSDCLGSLLLRMLLFASNVIPGNKMDDETADSGSLFF